MINTYRGSVSPQHLDHMGHMNVQYYAQKFDEATWFLFAECGITPTYIREKNLGMVAVDQQVTYKKEALVGDLINIYSGVLEIGTKTLKFVHAMRRRENDTLLAVCKFVAVHFDLETRKSCPFPEEVFLQGVELTKKYAVSSEKDEFQF